MDDPTIFTPADADLPAVVRVHIASWRSTYSGLVPDDYLAGLSFDHQLERHRRIRGKAGVRYVAARDDAGQVLGFASGGPTRDTDPSAAAAELYAVYLSADHQRRGYGRAMVRRIAREMASDGLPSLSAWVLVGNPARAFYERQGGRPDREQSIEIGGRTLAEVRYVWSDISHLF